MRSSARPKSSRRASAKKGVTDTIRATLSDGRITHDAQIQTVDIERALFTAGKASETNFKDTYRFNIGGYRLARLLGMTNVPMSVKRRSTATTRPSPGGSTTCSSTRKAA